MNVPTTYSYAPPEIDFSTFPESDGLPMADTEANLEQMVILIQDARQPLEPLGHHVGGNLLVYYDPADGRRHIAPDVFVALGAGTAFRESWKTWEEGKFPEVVFEIASPSTEDNDIGPKVTQYGELGAREYYIFDPAGRLDPAFRGYQARGGRLVRMANPSGTSIHSPLLGLELRVVGDWLRPINPATGVPYPLPREALAQMAAEVQARRDAEWREAEAREQAARAEAQATKEAAARYAADEQAEVATAQAAAATAQATHEAQARRAAEQQAAEAEARVQELLERLARFPQPDS